MNLHSQAAVLLIYESPISIECLDVGTVEQAPIALLFAYD